MSVNDPYYIHDKKNKIPIVYLIRDVLGAKKSVGKKIIDANLRRLLEEVAGLIR